jgi:hypothetical protein
MAGGVSAVRLPWLVCLLLLMELSMPELVPHFPSNKLRILDRQHQVKGCPAKMLADGFPIFGNCCDFHDLPV